MFTRVDRAANHLLLRVANGHPDPRTCTRPTRLLDWRVGRASFCASITGRQERYEVCETLKAKATILVRCGDVLVPYLKMLYYNLLTRDDRTTRYRRVDGVSNNACVRKSLDNPHHQSQRCWQSIQHRIHILASTSTWPCQRTPSCPQLFKLTIQYKQPVLLGSPRRIRCNGSQVAKLLTVCTRGS